METKLKSGDKVWVSDVSEADAVENKNAKVYIGQDTINGRHLVNGIRTYLLWNYVVLVPEKTEDEKERKAAIDEMWSEVNHLEKSSDICEALHNAGYHNGVRVGKQVDIDTLLQYIYDHALIDWRVAVCRVFADDLLSHFNIYRKDD